MTTDISGSHLPVAKHAHRRWQLCLLTRFGAGLCDRLARSCHLCAGSLDGTASFQGKSNCVSTCTLTSPPMPSRQLHNPGLRYFLSELPEGVSRSVPGTAESR